MILRPSRGDVQCIVYYVGRVIFAVGLLMLVPALVGALYGEGSAVSDFGLGFALAVALGSLVRLVGPGKVDPEWLHGMVVSALAWLVGTLVGAVPSWLSGHYDSYLDACFDLMSGYTTTGLVLIQDMDHASNALNMWRHLVTYAGGQGIVVIALTFLITGGAGAFRMYVGEAKDERIRPNVKGTARAIWLISLVWLAIGSAAMGVTLLLEGVSPAQAPLEAVWMFMSAWSTGGFAPYSQNTLYWHSLPFELINLVVMVVGSFNFALHFAVWTGRRRELVRNIEIVVFTVSVLVLFSLVSAALLAQGVYREPLQMMRIGLFQLVSAHTTTGQQTIYAQQFYGQWPLLATGAVIVAMLIGGSAASTAGGLKGLRVGILLAALVQDVKQLMLPEGVRVGAQIHHVQDTMLTDRSVRSAALVVIAYLALLALLTLAALGCGFPLPESLFEAASVTGNVGLSCGLTTAAMSPVLKVFYILGMWAARLEFAAVYVLAGFAVSTMAGVPGRRGGRAR